MIIYISQKRKKFGQKRKKYKSYWLEALAVENKRYKKWKAKTDIHRSFWLWLGKYSYSPKEAQIAAILKKQNIRFYREVSFDMKKRFDFYIPLIDLVIEYDGSQHFCLKGINGDIEKDLLLKKYGLKLIRYNKSHDLTKQIPFDLINHEILK